MVVKGGERAFRQGELDNSTVLHLQFPSFIMTSQPRRFDQLRVLTWDAEEDQSLSPSSEPENDPVQIIANATLPPEEHTNIAVKPVQDDDVAEGFGRGDIDIGGADGRCG